MKKGKNDKGMSRGINCLVRQPKVVNSTHRIIVIKHEEGVRISTLATWSKFDKTPSQIELDLGKEDGINLAKEILNRLGKEGAK